MTSNSLPEMLSNTNQGFAFRQAWENRAKALNRLSKSYPYDKVELLLSIIEHASPGQLSAERKRLVGLQRDYLQMSEYDQTLLQALVVFMVKEKERGTLVTLLATKCPPYVINASIEYYLATSALPDGILVLFESYQKSSNDGARRCLLQALSQGFEALRAKTADDESFVMKCKAWYLENKDKVRVNVDYPHVSGRPPLDPRIKPSAKSTDLFIATGR